MSKEKKNSPKVQLLELRINQFRNVQPTTLRFREAFNIPIGKNGSGKTTLLRLIVAAVNGDFTAYAKEEINIEWRITYGETKVNARFQNKRTLRPLESKSLPEVRPSTDDDFEFALDAVLESSTQGKLANFKATPLVLEVTIANNAEPIVRPWQGGLRIVRNLMIALLSASTFKDTRLLISSGVLDSSLVRFDESLEAYWRMKGWASPLSSQRDTASDEFSPTSLTVRVQGRDAKGAVSSAEYNSNFFPRSLFFSIFSSLTGKPALDVFEIPSSNVPFLARACQLLGFEKAVFRAEASAKTAAPEERWVFTRFGYVFFDSNDSWINDDYLSFGQRRLLSFLFVLSLNDHVCVADELLNGLHHEWIVACLDEIGFRQRFVTGQNPLLFDYLTFDSPEAVRDTFIICKVENQSGLKKTSWQRMSEALSHEFFQAYQVGFQRVSELLRDKGLW